MLTYAKDRFNSKNNSDKIRYHVFGWMSFVGYEAATIGLATGEFGQFRFYLIHYIINILLFYSHSKIVLPLSSGKKLQMLWKLPLFTCIEIGVYVLFKHVVDLWVSNIVLSTHIEGLALDAKSIFGGVWRSIYFIGFASAYYYHMYYLKERDSRENLERIAYVEEIKAKENLIELNNAKYAFLRAQINPHFLFNTLSFIYSNIHKTDPNSGKALILLSNIMRYALRSENGPEKVEMHNEIRQAEEFLALWKIRQEEERTEFIFDIEPGIEKIRFIPLVLLTLLENMFKHGNLSEESDPGILKIFTLENNLIIETVNLINTGLNDFGNHTGIQNIQQRLQLTYGNEGSMVVSQTDHHFLTRIKVPAYPEN